MTLDRERMLWRFAALLSALLCCALLGFVVVSAILREGIVP